MTVTNNGFGAVACVEWRVTAVGLAVNPKSTVRLERLLSPSAPLSGSLPFPPANGSNVIGKERTAPLPFGAPLSSLFALSLGLGAPATLSACPDDGTSIM